MAIIFTDDDETIEIAIQVRDVCMPENNANAFRSQMHFMLINPQALSHSCIISNPTKQTCPVDCIHYVPFDELKRLEVERRKQNINHKARLVNQGEYRSGVSSQYGGAQAFTDAQVISGNLGSRCNNCPSRGCKNCPMFGVGLNPGFQKKEEKRKERLAKAEMRKQMESQNKRAEL